MIDFHDEKPTFEINSSDGIVGAVFIWWQNARIMACSRVIL